MFLYYLNIFLTYSFVGLLVAVYFYYVLKKPLLGNFIGALFVGLIGSFLGGVIDNVFSGIIRYLSDFNSVNVFASLITSLLLVWVFSKVTPRK